MNTQSTNDTKDIFKECGTCSRTFAHLLNREFGHPKEQEERAMNLMAGGIMNLGYQCGMLWGSALAIGAEAHREYDSMDQAITAAVSATRDVVESFIGLTETINCKEIIGFDLSTKLGMAKFMLKVTSQGMRNSHCFNLAEQWAPQAIGAASLGIAKKETTAQKPISCASEVLRQLGGSEEEMTMVAGFAGGLGLQGGACGALSAAIWKKMLDWCRENPEKDPPYFNNKEAKKILRAFKAETKGKMLCSEICGQNFETLEEHSDYLRQDGCQSLLHVLTMSTINS